MYSCPFCAERARSVGSFRVWADISGFLVRTRMGAPWRGPGRGISFTFPRSDPHPQNHRMLSGLQYIPLHKELGLMGPGTTKLCRPLCFILLGRRQIGSRPRICPVVSGPGRSQGLVTGPGIGSPSHHPGEQGGRERGDRLGGKRRGGEKSVCFS